MEIVIGILGLILTAAGVYFAYKQMQVGRLTNSQTRGEVSMPKLSVEDNLDDDIVAIKQRRLHELRKKQALLGINTPAEILIEIEEIEKELGKLGKE